MKIAAFEILRFDELESTNTTALEYAGKGAGKKLVITAQKQTAGRGRRGRSWQSLAGNLFFSLLLEYPLKQLGTLIMASALSIAETIKEYQADADVKLKWPNDVLLNNAKVCGMLLEKGCDEYMVVGIGVNIKQSPQSEEMLYPVISLREAGITADAEDFLQKYLHRFTDNLQTDAAILRQKWLQNVKGLGQKITVKQEDNEITGIFAGIDENADLLLQTNGEVRRILAGDVFYVEKNQ